MELLKSRMSIRMVKMKRLSILKFDELVRLWHESECCLSMPELPGLVADGQSNCVSAYYTVEELYERFRETWREVVWPNQKGENIITKDVQCRYISDSLMDALRNCPLADFSHTNVQELLYTCALEDDIDNIEDDKQSHVLINNLI